MKKQLILMTILIMLITPNIKAMAASSAVAMDLSSNRVLYAHNKDEPRLIASISKIMTCIVAIENSDINKIIKVDKDVLKAYGSAIYIEVGEKLSINDLLYGLMLRSGNDAAIEIANNVSGSIDQFVLLMNKKAQEIGMKNTIFVNPHGLEENDGRANKSTAYDMALLTSYAYKNETFKNIFSTKNIKVKTNYKTYTWKNKNKLIHSYSFITGGKTGYTEKAKRTLVTTAEKDNKKIVIVTLNDSNDYSDHITLYQQLFKKYNAVKILDKEAFNIDNCSDCYINNDYYALVTKNEKKGLKKIVELEQKSNSNYAGTVKIYLNNELLHEEKIIKKDKEQKQTFFKKIINWIKSW